MLKRINRDFDSMVFAVVIWICPLPLIGLFVLPFLGLRVSLLIAIGLFIALFITCRGICGRKLYKK